MSVSVLNTDASISAKTITTNETNETISGVKTFSNDVKVNSTKKVYLDGGSDTYIDESAADTIDIATGGTVRVQIDNTKITISGGQIKFPAAQVASADVNTLDDYEEGSWTPILASSGGGTPTYTTQVGRYIKIGRLVVASCRCNIATKGTLAAGNVTVGGLPFTAVNVAGLLFFAHVNYFGMTTNIVNMNTYITGGASSSTFQHVTVAAAGWTTTQVADISATFGTDFTISYFADN